MGPFDLAGGVAFLQQTKEKNFPWVSANIFDESGTLLFNQVVKRTIQGQDIVITAISGKPTTAVQGVNIQPWEEILPALLQSIRKENGNSFIILLSSLSDAENRHIAEKFPDIRILLGADLRRGNVAATVIGQTLLTQTGDQGKYQGLLEISLGSMRKWGKDNQKKLAELQNRLGSVDWQLRRILKKANPSETSGKYEATIARLEEEKGVLKADISTMEEEVSKEKELGVAHDQFTYRHIGLKKSMPNDLPTEEAIRKLNQQIRELHQEIQQAKKTNASQQELQEAPPSFVGDQACGSCHEIQMDFWKTTRHARAYTTLVRKEKHLDTDCLPCHLTMDIPNNRFETFSLEGLLSYPEKLQSVGCESCHGGGKKHMANPERVKLVRVPGINICLSCHTDEHDDNFIYKTKLEKVSCPAG